jgi:hypothetical protein
VTAQRVDEKSRAAMRGARRRAITKNRNAVRDGGGAAGGGVADAKASWVIASAA